MSYQTIRAQAEDGILVLTLNRPEKLNAWTPQMGAELAAAISGANDDDDIDAIVVTGAGRGFCAGADIEAVFKAQAAVMQTHRGGNQRCCDRSRTHPGAADGLSDRQ